jgi:hypothetical protein
VYFTLPLIIVRLYPYHGSFLARRRFSKFFNRVDTRFTGSSWLRSGVSQFHPFSQLRRLCTLFNAFLRLLHATVHIALCLLLSAGAEALGAGIETRMRAGCHQDTLMQQRVSPAPAQSCARPENFPGPGGNLGIPELFPDELRSVSAYTGSVRECLVLKLLGNQVSRISKPVV